MLLREDFERLIWCLNHWLSCMHDYIHVCVFLFSKNCFKSFLDTWLAFSYRKLDTSSTPGGSIKKVPIPSIAYRHLVDRSSLISCVWCFCTSTLSRHLYLSSAKSSTPGSIPCSTPSSVEIYWGSIYTSLRDPNLISLNLSWLLCLFTSQTSTSHSKPLPGDSSSFFKFSFTW